MQISSNEADAITAVTNIRNSLLQLTVFPAKAKHGCELLDDLIKDIREDPATERDMAEADILQRIRNYVKTWAK